MSGDKAATSERIVKVPFPVALIRRMDQAIVAEQGGFNSRAELMREAVENLLNEMNFPDAPAEPARPGRAPAPPKREEESPKDGIHDVLSKVPVWEQDDLRLADLAGTALETPARHPVLINEGAARAPDEPLLGLHNRDYVSIWALHRLATYTHEGPIDFAEYLERVTQAAWFYGAQLGGLEQGGSTPKLTVLFPTNVSKRPSAERGFQNFAVGALGRRSDGDSRSASGPLFAWRAIQVAEDGAMSTGLTGDGWRLLQDLNGLSLELPHPPELATRFLAHLADVAPGDRWGFDQILRVGEEGPDREALISHFAADKPHWTAATASSVAQGYVARGREWGLVEPRLVDGRYWLTEAGREHAQDLK